MEWALINKKEIVTRKASKCDDCENDILPGSYAKRFTFKKDEDYKVKRICEDCEKYYRKKDLKI